MTANIFGNVAGFFRTPAWHGLGKTFQERLNTVDAGNLIGFFYPIDIEPIFYKNEKNEFVEIPDRKAVLRKPFISENSWMMGTDCYEIVSDHYSLVQNLDLANAFLELSDIFGVETIGALGQGEKVFISLDMGDILINGDVTHQNLLIVDDKTGKEATKIIYTPVRVVCQNTLVMGIKQATMSVNIRHKKGNQQKIINTASLITDIKKRVDYTNSLFADMAKIRFDLDEFKSLLNYLYTLPEKQEDAINVTKDFSKLFEKKQEEQNIAVEFFNKFNDEHSENGNNGWSAYNAIVEKEDWGMIKGTRVSNLPESTLFGSRAKTKIDAFNYIMKGA